MKVIGQHDNGINRERMPAAGVTKSRAQTINTVGQKSRLAVSQIHGKELAATWNKVASIVCHRSAALAERWVSQGLNPSY